MSRDQRSGPNLASLTVEQAGRHLSKAEEYLRTARTALEAGDLDAGDLDAAGGNAVLAGINAADSVSGLAQGNRWAGPHEQAAAHVQKAGADGKAVASHLRRLVRQKTRAHYEVKPLDRSEAATLVQAADRAVAAARRARARYESR